ncbi:EpsG family protein [Bacillus sp. 1P02SD]|uniref:EpsG family protein n=1 Tax=Bacillus sp. 1P02SD TaxID=3132264 RepID=UPI00399F53AA
MAVFWINLFSVYILSYFSRYFSKSSLDQPNNIKHNLLLFSIAIIILIIISGLRNNVGDTSAYMHSYEMNKFDWKNIDYSGDFGFHIYQILLQKLSDDSQILVFFTALLTNLFIGVTLYKYSRLIDLSLYVYITSGMFLVSMNGIRQYLAASIIFLSTKYILSGEWWKYFLVVIFSATIHKSALIMIPIYFIIRRKAWTKITIVLLISAIFIVLSFNQFTELLFTVIEDTQYGQYSDFDGEGANVLRVLVNSAPLIIAFVGREKLRQIFPNSDYIVNLSLLSLIFMIVATQNWIFARFGIYFGIYNLILMSWIIKVINKRGQKFIYYAILVCYFIYFYFEQVIGLGMVYRSDYIEF